MLGAGDWPVSRKHSNGRVQRTTSVWVPSEAVCFRGTSSGPSATQNGQKQ
ncbi:hypothetical protein ZHAS_00016211 [Anopheles sinensis]|uniref:Uncharacterized protein n=1 Tax=Anopheles sinensis TaxID=74873 RepID=A0A084WD53_ANOSI|nr:hypothetical protein ZHAS_00016211 [Anopheles sinensis]